MGPKSFRKSSLEQNEQLNHIVSSTNGSVGLDSVESPCIGWGATGQHGLVELGEELEVGADWKHCQRHKFNNLYKHHHSQASSKSSLLNGSELGSESVSEWVSDKHSQWSDSGPIKRFVDLRWLFDAVLHSSLDGTKNIARIANAVQVTIFVY